MPLLLLIALIVLIAVGPYLWTRRVLKKHARPREDFPGNGGELARHLLDKFELHHVAVVESHLPDHYDPINKQVSLTRDHYHGRSISAVAVAAHEVGHAIQDRRGERLFQLRLRLTVWASWLQRSGIGVILSIPLVFVLSKAPGLAAVMMLLGIMVMFGSVLIHLVTLPVELDASFGKALPILRAGGYFAERDIPAIRQVLRAAAMSYLAASLMSILNFWNWWRLLRRG